MRVSEMFIVGTMDLSDYESNVDSGVVVDYSNEYFNASVEELEELLKNQQYEKLDCQGNEVEMDLMDIETIKNELKKRIVNI